MKPRLKGLNHKAKNLRQGSVEQEERNKFVELLQAKEREISMARGANGGN